MYKIIKNVYKIRLRRDNFETCNIRAKRKKPFWCLQNFVPNMLSASAQGVNVEIHGKTCIKSDFKEIVLKLATNGQSDKGFLLTSTFVPKGLSAPTLGLYTCIKALKYIPGPGVRWAFTGPLVLWFKLVTSDKMFLLTSKFCPQEVCLQPPGLYTCIKSWKMCIKSDLELVANDRSDYVSVEIKIFVPWVICSSHEAIHIY